MLRRGGALERTLLAAEHDDIMAAIRTAVGDEVATGMSVGDVMAFMDRLHARRLGRLHAARHAPCRCRRRTAASSIVTAASVAAAHRVGLEVHVWTINEAAEIERLLDLGVDGVMSDLPGLVAAAVARRAAR